MSRTGKIARLPRDVRDQLNRRLDDGEPGPQVLAWLNERRDVRDILERDFGGRPINEQNLSEWRQGGLRDWQRQQEACEHVGRLTSQSEALNEAAEEASVSDRLATVFAVELFKVMEHLLEKSADDKERFDYLREGLREVRLMRRGDHNAARLDMEVQRWQRQLEREDEEEIDQLEEKSKARLIEMIFAKFREGTLAQYFGGGDQGRRIAELITKIKFDQPYDDLLERIGTNKASGGQPNGEGDHPDQESQETVKTARQVESAAN